MTRLDYIEFFDRVLAPSPQKDQILARYRAMTDEDFTNHMAQLEERHAKILRSSQGTDDD